MQTLWQDPRAGIRSSCKNPGFALLLSLTFGLGLMTSLAFWSLLHVTALPYSSQANPDRLALIWQDPNNAPDDFASPWAAGPPQRSPWILAAPPLTGQVQAIYPSQTMRQRLSEAMSVPPYRWLALIFFAGIALLVVMVRGLG